MKFIQVETQDPKNPDQTSIQHINTSHIVRVYEDPDSGMTLIDVIGRSEIFVTQSIKMILDMIDFENGRSERNLATNDSTKDPYD